MKRKLFILIGLFLLSAIPLLSGAGSSNDAVQYTEAGYINWSNGWIYATGTSVCNPQFPAGVQRAGMIVGARKDAQRKLLETVKGVTITSETIVQDFMTVSDTIKSSVSGMIQGAVMIGQPVMRPDCACEVTMAMPIYPNLTKALLQTAATNPTVKQKIEPPPQRPAQTYTYTPSTPKPAPPPPPPPNPPPPPPPPPPTTVKPQPTPPTTPPTTPPITTPPPLPPAPPENFPASKLKWDGLVIDARRVPLKPALLPVVYNEGGTIVYSRNNVNDETTIQAGITGYARDLDAAKRHFRVAQDPLVVVAKQAK